MVPELNLKDDDPQPLYEQLYEQLREHILDGRLQPGMRLPASRTLAKHAHVARVTVVQAYKQLQAEGYLESRVGAGTFVSAELPMHSVTQQPFHPTLAAWGQRVMQQPLRRRSAESSWSSTGLIDFGFGRSFPHIFPYDIWRRILARYLSTDDVMLSRYGSPAGFTPLRQAVADYLSQLRGVNCDMDQVVIVSGAQQALDILARLLLEPGEEVLVESPGYPDAFAVFSAQGMRLVALPVDEEGCQVEAIPHDTQARLVFVTPSNQFPQGGAMPVERRLALLNWARRRAALVIEDDYDGELRYESRPLTALQGLDTDGRVAYLGTFSKVLFPALRLGYLVLPHALIEPFVQAKAVVDRGAPTLTQAAVADFITEGHFERHLRRLRKEYGRRRAVLDTALETLFSDHIWHTREPAGLHVMLYLPVGVEEEQAVQAAAAVAVRVYPGAAYHLHQPAPPSVMLGFTGLDEFQIEEGVRRLAQAWRTLPEWPGS